jgi:hypothetical protein
MLTRLREAILQRRAPPSARAAPDQAATDLLGDVSRLPPEQRAALAAAVAALWAAFRARFGGPQAFLTSEDDRAAYHRQLGEFVGRFGALRGTDREHAVLSAALMLQYTSLIGRADLSASERQVSALVAEMITRGGSAANAGDLAQQGGPASAGQRATHA